MRFNTDVEADKLENYVDCNEYDISGRAGVRDNIQNFGTT